MIGVKYKKLPGFNLNLTKTFKKKLCRCKYDSITDIHRHYV